MPIAPSAGVGVSTLHQVVDRLAQRGGSPASRWPVTGGRGRTFRVALTDAGRRALAETDTVAADVDAA
jgi:DNA-binding MarR family transcriptional regulator